MTVDGFTARKRANEDNLAEVASKIRPLPEGVTPSAEFLSRTRLRLLKLDPTATPGIDQGQDQQAA